METHGTLDSRLACQGYACKKGARRESRRGGETMQKSKLVFGAVSLTMASIASTAHAEWITTWATAPLAPSPAVGQRPATPSFENRTLRQILRVSAGGSSVRLRLTNAYGQAPLAIGAARIALLDDRGQEVPGSSRILTFGGDKTATAATGAPLVSDSVDLAVPSLAKMVVTLYLPGNTGPCTCHQVGLDRLEVSAPGDFSAEPFVPESTLTARAFLAAVEVDAPEGAATVAIIGDSISDGVGSTNGADRRWPDRLAERLAARQGRVWGVANQGISGNRVLADGAGVSALARFDRDVLSLPGVEAVIVFEGVNDLGIGFGRRPANAPGAGFPASTLTSGQMIDGYRQLITRAHARGVRIFGATIAPYKGAGYWSEEGEAARQAINEWIRSGGEFDGVLDFDHAFADPTNPEQMREGYHMGDFLHGSDAGYLAVAESVDLSLFEP
jgi:lysophospholipase L1-like esterase